MEKILHFLKNKINVILFFSFAIFLLSSIKSSAQSGEATIYLDNTQQVIHGFGAANIIGWRPDMTTAQVNTAFGTGNGQIGFTILRLRISPNENEFNIQVSTSKLASSLGAKIIASPWTPPASMKSNNSTIGGYLKESSYAAYAAHLKAFADYMSNNGVPIYAISVQNEPDVNVTYESCDWDSSQMLKFVQENARSIGTKVIAPESYHFYRGLSDPLLNDSTALANFDILGGHIYGSGLEPYPLAESKGKEIWMTEHLDTDTSWSHVLATGKEINDCMNDGMSAYVWWYIVRFYGPIDESGNVTKRGYIMSQFSKFIRPDYYKVSATENPQTGVYVTAYKSATKLVVVVVNENSTPTGQTFNLINGPFNKFTPYVTSKTKNSFQEK